MKTKTARPRKRPPVRQDQLDLISFVSCKVCEDEPGGWSCGYCNLHERSEKMLDEFEREAMNETI